MKGDRVESNFDFMNPNKEDMKYNKIYVNDSVKSNDKAPLNNLMEFGIEKFSNQHDTNFIYKQDDCGDYGRFINKIPFESQGIYQNNDPDQMKESLFIPNKQNNRLFANSKTRSRTTTDQLTVLENVCKTTLRPNKETRIKLAHDLNMNQRQIQIWFQNKRAKMKKNMENHNYMAMRKFQDKEMINPRSMNFSFDKEPVFQNLKKFPTRYQSQPERGHVDEFNPNYNSYANSTIPSLNYTNGLFNTTYLRNYNGISGYRGMDMKPSNNYSDHDDSSGKPTFSSFSGPRYHGGDSAIPDFGKYSDNFNFKGMDKPNGSDRNIL